MEGILVWSAAGFGALFFVAIVVAWWEHLGREAVRQPAEMAPVPQPAPRQLTLDVNLDALPQMSDAAVRRGVLGHAMARMTQPGALGDFRRRWPDTAPMIGPGVRAEPQPAIQRPAEPRRTESPPLV